MYVVTNRTVRQCAESLRNDLPPESESSNQLQELVFDLRTDTMRTILKQVSYISYIWLYLYADCHRTYISTKQYRI